MDGSVGDAGVVGVLGAVGPPALLPALVFCAKPEAGRPIATITGTLHPAFSNLRLALTASVSVRSVSN